LNASPGTSDESGQERLNEVTRGEDSESGVPSSTASSVKIGLSPVHCRNVGNLLVEALRAVLDGDLDGAKLNVARAAQALDDARGGGD
jgi:hypothetical protein